MQQVMLNSLIEQYQKDQKELQLTPDEKMLEINLENSKKIGIGCGSGRTRVERRSEETTNSKGKRDTRGPKRPERR